MNVKKYKIKLASSVRQRLNNTVKIQADDPNACWAALRDQCCCPTVNYKIVIAIINSNGITDDDFRLSVNNNFIANVIEPHPGPPCQFLPSAYGQVYYPSNFLGTRPPPPLMTYYYNLTLVDREYDQNFNLLCSKNTIVLNSIKDNRCGNYGTGHVFLYDENDILKRSNVFTYYTNTTYKF